MMIDFPAIFGISAWAVYVFLFAAIALLVLWIKHRK